MKLDIFSHCAIDTISINDTNHIVPGGAACYCSLMAKALKFDVILHTKFGPDFSLFDYLSKKKILIENALSEKPTTKFILKILSSDRTLFLEIKGLRLFCIFLEALGLIKQFLTLNAIKIIVQFEGASRAHHS